MAQLVPLQLDDGSKIYIEVAEDVTLPASVNEATEPNSPPQTRTAKGLGLSPPPQQQMAQGFQAMESTIRTYTSQTLGAFKEMALADVTKVTLEFGLKIGGEAGVPYVTKGTAESNLKITVECRFDGSK